MTTKSSLLDWLSSARKKYPQYKFYEVQLRLLPTGEHQIIRFAARSENVQRDSSGVQVLEQGKSWPELGLKKVS